MDYTVEENIPGLLIFIDFEKAFDSVEWDFLFKCLEAFNFGSDFLHWIKTFYTNAQSCVMNYGTASNYFPLERGVRQGDPLSPYLFIVIVETLAIAIRQNQEIRGISIDNEETKILPYADDTTAVLSDISSAEQLFELLNFFKDISRLKINWKKRRLCGLVHSITDFLRGDYTSLPLNSPSFLIHNNIFHVTKKKIERLLFTTCHGKSTAS